MDEKLQQVRTWIETEQAGVDRDKGEFSRGVWLGYDRVLGMIDQMLPPTPQSCPWFTNHITNDAADIIVQSRENVYGSDQEYWAYCKTCGAQGPVAASKEAALIAWNTRGAQARAGEEG